MQKNKLKFLRRGFAKKCPNCGLFPIFSRYVKTHKKCSKCGINFSEYKSDDGPAYCTIFLVGHFLIPLILIVEKKFSPAIFYQMILWPLLTIISCLWLLPRVKGAFIAAQIFLNDKKS